VLSESPDGREYEVETLEVKCPPTYDNYIKLFECDYPAQLKVEEPKYYWQVIDQMDMCGSMVGNFMVYHPDFKAGNMNMIKFRRNQPEIDKYGNKIYPINDDIKLLKSRKQEAEILFNMKRDKLLLKEKF
jgi:hypothetical protein